MLQVWHLSRPGTGRCFRRPDKHPRLTSNASLADSPIVILLWTFPLKSHFADAGTGSLRPLQLSSSKSCAAPPAAVDPEFPHRSCSRRRGTASRCDVLRLSCSAGRHPGFGHLVRVNRRVAVGGRRYLHPDWRVDHPPAKCHGNVRRFTRVFGSRGILVGLPVSPIDGTDDARFRSAVIGPGATCDVVRRLQRALCRTPDLEISVYGILRRHP